MTGEPETPDPRRPAWVEAWFAPLIARARFRVDDMDLADSRAWKLSGGAIRHVSGLFFSVTGVQWLGSDGARISQALIEQREIGTLGFVMRAGARGNELLVQAKMEPGNVGVAQLAPTCQATASNAARVHGGEAPPFSTLFAPVGGAAPLHESLQSEQGSRFLGKRNRNVLLRDPGGIEPGPTHRWLPVDDVLSLLAHDFLLNTDARSVLVCSPWETLTGHRPFSRHATRFGAELARSHAQHCDRETLVPVRKTLEQLRSTARPPRTVDLAELDGWRLDRSGLAPTRGGA